MGRDMNRLYETLLEYPKKGYYPAHMPGHKGNITDGFLREALRYDITEIDGFDNLHDASGIIDRMQKKIAKQCHAQESSDTFP